MLDDLAKKKVLQSIEIETKSNTNGSDFLFPFDVLCCLALLNWQVPQSRCGGASRAASRGGVGVRICLREDSCDSRSDVFSLQLPSDHLRVKVNHPKAFMNIMETCFLVIYMVGF